HDGVLQSLTGTALKLESVQRLWQTHEQAARERLSEIQRLIAEEQRNLRLFIRDSKLGPVGASSGEMSLDERLRELVRRLESVWGLQVELLLEDLSAGIADGLEGLFRLEPDFQVVARCINGEETLVAVRRHRPDILILDLRMPRGDGLEILRTLRRERLPTKVVLLAGALEEDEILEALRLG